MTGKSPETSLLATHAPATVFETGYARMLPSAIHAVAGIPRCSGPAFTVTTPPGNNLWLHRAVYQAAEGDVLVVSVGDAFEFGYWGDILTTAALERKLAGLVINGCVRDKAEIDRLGFPVFARGLCVRGTGKEADGGHLGRQIHLGETLVTPGDVIVADADGVVVVSQGDVADAASSAIARDDKERDIARRLHCGESTLEIYGWPA